MKEDIWAIYTHVDIYIYIHIHPSNFFEASGCWSLHISAVPWQSSRQPPKFHTNGCWNSNLSHKTARKERWNARNGEPISSDPCFFGQSLDMVGICWHVFSTVIWGLLVLIHSWHASMPPSLLREDLCLDCMVFESSHDPMDFFCHHLSFWINSNTFPVKNFYAPCKFQEP